jgi:hypothetical protein
MQASAQVAYSGYGGYEGDNWQCAYPGDAGAVAAGFKWGYGSKSVFEDVETYVEMFYDEDEPFASHGVCQQFSGLTDEVPRPVLVGRVGALHAGFVVGFRDQVQAAEEVQLGERQQLGPWRGAPSPPRSRRPPGTDSTMPEQPGRDRHAFRHR